MRITRRKLAQAVIAAPALAGAQPQTGARIPSTPKEELELARGRVRSNSELLSKQQVPMEVEPACHFKA